jgi:hypothetical protein
MSLILQSPRLVLAAVGVAGIAAGCGGSGVGSAKAAVSPTAPRSAPAVRMSRTACELATADEVKGAGRQAPEPARSAKLWHWLRFGSTVVSGARLRSQSLSIRVALSART